MKYIAGTVAGYVLFNIAVWLSLGVGGLSALAVANALGGALTLAYYWKAEIAGKGAPRVRVAVLGACGVTCIVMGLRIAHSSMPVYLSMEAVYNGFAVVSWPLFVLLGVFLPQRFADRPNRVDLLAHTAMSFMVIARFWNAEVVWTGISVGGVILAILGYALFNIAIKLAAGHRATNVTMNGIAVCMLAVLSCMLESGSRWSAFHGAGAALGGAAVFTIVRELGASYKWFGSRKQASLVAPLVYDGLLIVSPLVTIVTGGFIHDWPRMVSTAAGMIAITVFRWWYHTHKK